MKTNPLLTQLSSFISFVHILTDVCEYPRLGAFVKVFLMGYFFQCGHIHNVQQTYADYMKFISCSSCHGPEIPRMSESLQMTPDRGQSSRPTNLLPVQPVDQKS